MRKKMISLMMTVAMGTVMISGATVVKADSDEKETVKLAVWSSGAADNFQKGADEFNKRQDKINFVVKCNQEIIANILEQRWHLMIFRICFS